MKFLKKDFRKKILKKLIYLKPNPGHDFATPLLPKRLRPKFSTPETQILIIASGVTNGPVQPASERAR